MGTILTETPNFDTTVVSPNPGEPIRASDILGTSYLVGGVDANGGVIYTALTPAARVQQLGGLSKTLAVTVSGNDITVQLSTDNMGNVTSTANQVVTAFNANPMATALATATAQGTGNSAAGVNTAFIAAGQGAQGSIRPPLQSLTNRARYLYNKVRGILFGTISVKSIYADGTGDGTSSSAGADIGTTGSLRAAGQAVVQGNISSFAGVIQTINSMTGDISAAHNLTSANDAVITNEMNAYNLQVNRSRMSSTLANPTIPLGQGNIGNLICGGAYITCLTPTNPYVFSYGLNVKSIATVGDACQITFNVSASYVIPFVTAPPAAHAGSPTSNFPTVINARIIGLSPNVIIEVTCADIGPTGGRTNRFDFSLAFIAE